ncbi:hypothetical protein A2348_04880 [Candidatus Uhrbacteria bacterium RIFOXYB12_FULL_58_10]|uniref:General secretion pathway GspH domain-containing protein n=1 Tax=Candidatus Uhrbacteria bacterium RIFOXYB2_FULL_57_15 TaxID=1802422 RepID=A0A1F7W7L5_9BACT|nr:MAG: hypothetical protein A2348_04880 [Candidatus Uhrbacteria bacterium RIFOXYB12_FULL_58_10]OGL98805.1 MAG: hypothetical protein A2304_04905 [Candidatus Uhrbacteria bacterium RIFOXYB2_FULL_57_15]OGL99784.1 MAG: hypothetical protein A2501_04650 [Candidatus Uhrbacteria bacterium RIFOXYC12_FULL_57_11]
MRSRNGFTLAEVTIVLGLFGILVMLGTTLSGSFLRDQYLRTAGETVIAELRRAQIDAWSQADDSAHGIKVLTDSVVRYSGDTYASRTPALDKTTNLSSEISVPETSEIAIPKGATGPSVETMLSIDNDSLAIDITLTPYGVLTVAERTIGH